jgi:amino acid adenylation domain-containing protein
MGDLAKIQQRIPPFTLLSDINHGPNILPDKIREMARICRVEEESIKDAYPCSPMQDALMAASAETNSNSYMLQMVCKLSDWISLADFQRAWQETAQANPIMRTRIIQLEPYGTIQIVVDEDSIWCTASSLQDHLREDAGLQMSFGDPLWRFAIVKSTGDTGLVERFFTWTLHHAVCDGFSVQEVLKCVALRYKNQPLPEHQPFTSFIWLLRTLNSTDSKDYWRSELGNSSSLPFPALPDSGFRAVPSSVFTRDVIFRQPDGLGISKTLILQSTWALLLSNHTRTPEVTFGAISSGRSAVVEGIRQMSGPTITIVPVTIHVDQAQAIMHFLGTAIDRAKKMLPYEHTGLSNIRRYLGEDGFRACNFQNLLVIQPGAFSSRAAEMMRLLGMNVLEQLWKMETHSYPLVTTITYTSNGFNLRMEYDNRVLHKQQVINLSNQYEEILRQLSVADPASPIGSITALSPADKAQIFAWNECAPVSRQTCLHDLFRNQVNRGPENAAICSWDGNLTYSELDNISSALAIRLTEMGVGPEILVAMCFEKSMWTVVAILAIFKAGGAYIPLDPSHPRDRLREIINLTKIEFAITSHGGAEALQGLCTNILLLDSNISYDSEMGIQSVSRASPSNTAYIIFTSGSTGKPKGVVMQHSALCTSVMEHGKRLGFCSDWRTLQFSSHTFDVSIGEMLTTLAFGGCICIPSNHQRMNDLSQAIRDIKVNVALLTPTVANLITPQEVPSLHTLILGGESATQENINHWANHVRLTNAFGPTEACVYCSTAELSIESDPSNIGKSVGGNTWIVNPDDHDSLMPIGCIGEMVVSGPTLGREYFECSSETEAAFVPAPRWMMEAGHTSRRIYKTGDLVKYHHDGTMQFIGRKDSQVKIRGFRVELGEIEHRISEASKTGSSVAAFPSSGQCKDKLVSVISFDARKHSEGPGRTIELASDFIDSKLDNRIQTIRAELSTHVPDYMVPSIWVVLKEIPILSSGKMDRKAVKTWVENMDSVTYALCLRHFEHTGTLEFTPGSLIYDLRISWTEVLNVPAEEIGSESTFMSLGGDSISAIQLVAKCKKIGIKLSVQDILRSKTLGRLAAVAWRTEGTSHTQTCNASYSPNTMYQLSPIQQMFFALNGSVAKSVRYNQGFVVRLQQDIAPGVFRGSFDAIVQKHPMLRARFVSAGNHWQQKCLDFSSDCYRLRIHGLLTKEKVRLMIKKAHSSINIANGPVFAVDIFSSESGREISFAAHHSVVDLVSWRTILQDLDDFVKIGTLSPQTSISFLAWTQCLKQKFTGASVPVTELSSVSCADYTFWSLLEAENTYAHLEKLAWELDPESTQLLLRNSIRLLGSEPIDLMISALAFSFSQTFNNRECPPVFVEGHGREPWSPEIDLFGTVGWFTVLYPISRFPAPEEGVNSFLSYVRDARKQHSDNGIAYFSRQIFCTDETHETPAISSREIQFNYQGVYQQFDNESSLFRLADYEDLEGTLVGPEIRRNAIFEIEAKVRNKCLEFSFAFNEEIEHRDLILTWVQEAKTVLMEMIQNLSNGDQSSFECLLMNCHDETEIKKWDNMLHDKLGAASDVLLEDAYPCSPFQANMLKCQSLDPSVFNVKWGIEISKPSGAPVNPAELEEAWRLVVSRHVILRTIFLLDTENTMPLQVVLKNPKAEIKISSLSRGTGGEENTSKDVGLERKLLPHALIILPGEGGTVKCMFEASHAILDGWSLRLLMRDFLSAYENKLSSAPSRHYKNFINLFEPAHIEEDRAYWKAALHQQPPCLLLPPTPQSTEVTLNDKLNIITLPSFPVTTFSEISTSLNLTTASIIDAAWAQTLLSLLSQSSIAFGYTVSGRDLPIDNALEIVGPMVNLLTYHLPNVEPDESLIDLARKLQGQRMRDSEHAFCGIHDVAEELAPRGKLFNTGVNYQRISKEMVGLENGGGDLRVKALEGSDPWDVSTINLPCINGKKRTC